MQLHASSAPLAAIASHTSPQRSSSPSFRFAPGAHLLHLQRALPTLAAAHTMHRTVRQRSPTQPALLFVVLALRALARHANSPSAQQVRSLRRKAARIAAASLAHALTQHPGLPGLRRASCAPHHFHRAAARATHNSAPLPTKVRPCASCPLSRSVRSRARKLALSPHSCSPSIAGILSSYPAVHSCTGTSPPSSQHRFCSLQPRAARSR